MHDRLLPLVDNIERQRTALIAAVVGQPTRLLDAKPSPEEWSPSEILDHLAIVESGVAGLLAKRLLRAKEAGLALESSTEPVRSPLDSASLTQKIDAPENVRPTPNTTAAIALERLGDAHAALYKTLAAADGYDLSAVTAHHQIFGELNMYEWLIFLSRHEQRHIAQVIRTLASARG
jgi:hypothetical protein